VYSARISFAYVAALKHWPSATSYGLDVCIYGC